MGLPDLFSDSHRQPAACIVRIDGRELNDLYPALSEVKVETSRQHFAEATLTFDTHRLEDGVWTVQDDERLLPWRKVTIEADFGGPGPQEVMSGYVKSVRAGYPQDHGSAQVTVTCQDHSLLLDRQHVNHRWGHDAPISDGQIVREIAGLRHVGLQGEPASGQQVRDLLQNTTDIRFLRRRAQANGYELIFHQGRLYFGEMRLSGQPQPTILVYAGQDTNCIRFDIDNDGHKPDRVAFQVAAEAGSESSTVEVEPDLPLLGTESADSTGAALDPFVWRPQRQGVDDEQQMRAIAQRMVNEQSFKIKVTGELDGTMYANVLRVAETVDVDGVGERYSGTYYVDAVTHKFDANGYAMSFTLLRNAYGASTRGISNPLQRYS